VEDEGQGGEEDGPPPALGLHGRHHEEERDGGTEDQAPDAQPPFPVLLHGAALQPLPQSRLQDGLLLLLLLQAQQLVLKPGQADLDITQLAVDAIQQLELDVGCWHNVDQN